MVTQAPPIQPLPVRPGVIAQVSIDFINTSSFFSKKNNMICDLKTVKKKKTFEGFFLWWLQKRTNLNVNLNLFSSLVPTAGLVRPRATAPRPSCLATDDSSWSSTLSPSSTSPTVLSQRHHNWPAKDQWLGVSHWTLSHTLYVWEILCH